MERLTFSAEAELSAMARRFGVARASVRTALDAVVQGSAKLAQFQCAELGGQVRWIRGGRAMLSDSAAPLGHEGVTALCEALARLVESSVVYDARSSAVELSTDAVLDGAHMAEARRGARASWYPDELGTPSASGGQNGMHYAVFPATRRLAIDRVGRIDVYDTLDHHIVGVQQDADGSVFDLTFTSEQGTFRLDGLPRVGPARPERAGAPSDEEDTMGDPDDRAQRVDAAQAAKEAGQGRAETQGDFGGDVGPDRKPIEGPSTRGGDAEQGYTQSSGHPQSGGGPAEPAPVRPEPAPKR